MMQYKNKLTFIPKSISCCCRCFCLLFCRVEFVSQTEKRIAIKSVKRWDLTQGMYHFQLVGTFWSDKRTVQQPTSRPVHARDHSSVCPCARSQTTRTWISLATWGCAQILPVTQILRDIRGHSIRGSPPKCKLVGSACLWWYSFTAVALVHKMSTWIYILPIS